METVQDSSPSAMAETPVAAAALPAPQTPAEKPGFLKRNSLRLSGILNFIGDIGFLGRGIKNRDKFAITGGALYTLGGLNLALFGRVKTKNKEKQTTRDVAEFLETKTGHAAPDAPIVTRTDAEKDVDHALYHHAAQNTLYAYTLGAAAVLASRVKIYRADKKQWAGVAYGISSLVFKLASLLVPEKSKKDDGDSKEKKGFINWIREKPLRIFGYGSLITDSLLGVQTYQEYKYDRKAETNYMWSGLTTISYLLSDVLIANSNKNPENAAGKLAPEEQQRVELLAAKSISREPEEKQQALLGEVSAFLAARQEVSGKAEDISRNIRAQMETLGKKPWAARVSAEPLALQQQPLR